MRLKFYLKNVKFYRSVINNIFLMIGITLDVSVFLFFKSYKFERDKFFLDIGKNTYISIGGNTDIGSVSFIPYLCL